MFALIALLVSQTAHPALVFVPEDSTPDGCFATEHVAAVIALTPSLRLVRGAVKEKETLEAARARYGCDVAIDGSRKVLATGNEEVTLHLARENKAIDSKTANGPPLERAGAVLRAIWPSDLPKLADAGAPAAANAEALEAACAKDAAKAYAASGAAIGTLVRKHLPPPVPEGRPRPNPNESLFLRWAKATALERAGKCKDAVPMLRLISFSLSKNEWGPTWRRAPKSEAASPSALDLFNGTIIAFENGTFAAIDAKNGVDRWRLEVGASTPHLTDAADGLLLAALSGEIAAIDLEDGHVRWRVPLRAPSPEIAQMGGRIYVAGEENVLALDRSKGDVVWRFDPLADMIAGPSVAGSNLAVVADSAVLLLDPTRGTEVKKIDLGDEISAPLTVTAKGSIWAMVGGDQIVNVDPATSEVRVRAQDVPGAEWPPALASEQLVVVLRKKDKKRAVAYLDASAKNPLKRSFLGAPPVLELPSFAGVVYVEERPPAIVARDLEGGVLWKVIDRQRIAQLSREGDLILAAVGNRARILEPKKGATIAEIDFGEPVKQVVLGAAGGAALVESGAVYGFPSPSDVRPKSWLRDARLELGDCFLVLGQGANAAATAKQILERDPDDLDARAMFAASEEKTKPREAAERWLALSAVASKNDPLQDDVQRAQHALAGIDGPLIADAPINDVVAVGDGVLVISTENGVEGRALEAPFARVWKKPPAVIAAAPDACVRVGKEVVRAKDGSKVAELTDPSASQVLRGAMFRVTKSADKTEIAREGADGKAMWTQSFEQAELGVADASAEYAVLIEAGERSSAHVVRAASGERVWMLPLGERARGASISGDRVLFSMEKRLLAVDAESGKELYSIAVPAADIASIVPFGNGWIVVAKGKLRIIDRAKGRLIAQLPLIVPLTAIAAVDKSAIAAFDDGTIASIDLVKGVIDGKLRPGKVTRLISAESKVLAVLDNGTLLSIDPTRKLRPALTR